MRFWSGAEVTFGSDYFGAAIMISGSPQTRVVVPHNLWRLDEEQADGTRLWRLAAGKGTVERIQKPADNALSATLANALMGVEAAGLHPAIQLGLEAEARRLYPEIERRVDNQFHKFLAYLRDNFGLRENDQVQEGAVPFVDNFGPELLVLVDGYPAVLPELPPLYHAPGDWQRTMWWVANSMVGPLLSDEIEPQKRIQFHGAKPSESDFTPRIEGLLYYQAARAMAAWAAWEQNPEARFLQGVMDSIMAGHRPWKTSQM